MKYIFTLLSILIMTTACTKKEFKSNFSNVKEGTKKTWKSTKEGFAETTEEFKNQ